ncbi:MAG: 2-C-methyl-D-erythritol 2,4-cyclodiphosphate synthase [Planctomycetota bacterium]|nr:2-C-methyl-D-erythritol 2,4-cyclodiphosphate synthase [Planctomycetota bacterium]
MNLIGFGFDSHRFVAGRPLILGGVHIKHDLGLGGHSDADALIHAIIDALLGAAGLGDIGERFPDTSKKWKDADSTKMLVDVVGELAQMGMFVINCDATVVAETPKLSAYKMPMRERIADLLGLDISVVSVKAKTAEGMGPIGSGEGVAAFAVVLIEEEED